MDDQEHNYTININWKEGRIGTMKSPELDQEIDVATPPQFPGGEEGIWSPEHLFVAAVSSCLMTTFIAIAEYSKLEYHSLDIQATGKLAKVEGKFMMTEVVLKPKLVIKDEKSVQKAERILHKAEAACLISRSIKSEIILETDVQVLAPVEG
jgi:peroxiredoxin-like protein